VRFKFKKKKTRDLYSSDKGAQHYPGGVVDSFFEAMAAIESAKDERDLRKLNSFHFKKLEGGPGKRGEHSLRLNRQYRLILVIKKDDNGKYLEILEIDKH
jgi:toxin HigB-1